MLKIPLQNPYLSIRSQNVHIYDLIDHQVKCKVPAQQIRDQADCKEYHDHR